MTKLKKEEQQLLTTCIKLFKTEEAVRRIQEYYEYQEYSEIIKFCYWLNKKYDKKEVNVIEQVKEYFNANI